MNKNYFFFFKVYEHEHSDHIIFEHTNISVKNGLQSIQNVLTDKWQHRVEILGRTTKILRTVYINKKI